MQFIYNPNIEFLIPLEVFSNIKKTGVTNIAIISFDLEMPENYHQTEEDIIAHCKMSKETSQTLENLEVIQHECHASNKIIDGQATIFSKNENIVPYAMTVQYSTFINSNKNLIINLTCKVSICDQYYEEFDDIVGSIRKTN